MIVHDHFSILGGGERLVLELARHRKAFVLTGWVDRELYQESGWIQGIPIRPLLPFSLPPPFHGLLLALAFPLLARPRLPRDGPVLFSGNFAPLAVPSQRSGPNVFYCHTPPRFLFDLKDPFRREIFPGMRPFWDLALRAYRRSFVGAVARMDLVIANSENVRTRIQRYLGLDAQVVYPPCDLTRFRWLGQADYYLSTARLDPPKRVGLLMEAFCRMPHKRLIVISGGPELPRLRRCAQRFPNIRVLGWVPEHVLQELMGRCIATLYIPKDEDLGMSPMESMAAGKPVIGVAEGGLKETVIHGETGLLLPPDPTIEQIMDAVEALPPHKAAAMRRACEKRARRFAQGVFLENMDRLLSSGLHPKGGEVP